MNPGMSTSSERASQRIVDDLGQKIKAGDLEPGDRLESERGLVELYGLSRPTVREALRILESQHLIELSPGDRRGARVLGFSSAPARASMQQLADTLSLSDLVQFRMVADGTASLAAAHRRSPADLVAIEQNLARMHESQHAGFHVFSVCDLEFHEIVARVAGNPVIEMWGEIVRSSILTSITQTIAEADDHAAIMLQTIRHHQSVYSAIAAQDGIHASRISREALYTYYSPFVPEQDREILADLVREVGGIIQ